MSSDQPKAPVATTEQLPGGSEPAFAVHGCVLYVADGVDRGASLRLTEGAVEVGTSAECGLVLTDGSVSRRHTRFSMEGGVVTVEDLGSTNGTRYLEQRVDRITLEVGARLALGKTILDVLPLSGDEQAALSRNDSYGDLRGASVSMRRLYAVLERIEKSDVPVLIDGETGTGKELVARAIHERSARAEAPLVIIDCGSVPGELIESELFGHRKGSFTGATEEREGAFGRAHGGTVFLDEIGELPLELQTRLLRVLESGEVKKIGDNAHAVVDVRVLAATNRDLEAAVAAGRFRQDLYYRIAVMCLRLPPLRERPDDIPMLTHHLAMELSGGKSGKLPRAAQDFFLRYDWPGNVRELRNAVERILTLGVAGLPEAGALGASGPDTSGLDYKEARRRVIASFERAYLVDLLEQADGNLSAAARAAGIDRKHLRELLKKYDLYSSE